MKKNNIITGYVDDKLKERLTATCDKFDLSTSYIIKNTLENFLPFTNIPEDFIMQAGLGKIFNQGVPLRAVLPFLSSMLGYNMINDYTIKIRGKEEYINPYPEYSVLCMIKLIERLYQAIKVNENG